MGHKVSALQIPDLGMIRALPKVCRLILASAIMYNLYKYYVGMSVDSRSGGSLHSLSYALHYHHCGHHLGHAAQGSAGENHMHTHEAHAGQCR